MRRRNSPPALRALTRCAAAVLTLACGGPATGSQSSGNADGDSPQTIAVEELPVGASITEAYRFALTPAGGWRIAREDELGRFGPGVAAGAILEGGLGYAAVTVEAAPGLSLERAAELTLAVYPGADRVLEAQEPVRFLGITGIRQVISARPEGVEVRWTNTIFIHQGHIYRLSVWGRVEPANIDSFLGAFALLEGPVVRPPRETVQHAVGDDWRIEGGVLSSLSADLTTRSADGWRVVIDRELSELHAEALIGLVHAEPDVYAIVLAEAAPARVQDGLAAYLRGTTAETLGGAPVGTRTLPFGGSDLTLSVYRAAGFEYLHGVRCDGERCRQLLVWYVEGASAEAARALERMPVLDALPAAQREATRAALERERRDRRHTGAYWGYRGATYLDLARGMRMRVPNGSFWHLARESETASDAQLHFAERVAGLTGVFLAEDLEAGSDPAAFHRNVQAAIGVRDAGAPQRATVGSSTEAPVQGLVSVSVLPLPFGELSLRVVTAVVGARGYRLAFWGWPEQLSAAGPAIDRLLETVVFTGARIPGYRFTGDRLVDERFGMALRLPEGGTHSDMTEADSAGLGMAHGVQYPDGSLVQLLATQASGDSAQMREELARSMIERLRPRLGPGVTTQLAQSTMAGRPAITVRWEGAPTPVEMRAVVVDELSFILMVIGRRDAESLVQGFELLE